MIGLMLTIELLQFTPSSQRALSVLQAFERAGAGVVSVTRTTSYQGRSDVLLLWGPGAPDRFEPMRAQLATRGHVLALDLAYWQRGQKVSVSIDAAHPQRWVMKRDWPADRLRADAVPTANQWNPAGPIVVAGIGRKALAQYGSDVVFDWERGMIATAIARWRRPVVYRPKQADAPHPHVAGCAVASSTTPIERVLEGAALLVTWHSNVAVDAIRLGIPVICMDGAAAAVCPNCFGTEDPSPLLPAVRDRFLQNLAYFQWAPSEGPAFWRWATEVLA